MSKLKLSLSRGVALAILSSLASIILFSFGACSKHSRDGALTSEQSMLIPYRKGDKWGYSDAKKKLVIQPKYQMAEPFNDGVARVCSGSGSGFIDKTGKEVVPLKYNQYARLLNRKPFA